MIIKIQKFADGNESYSTLNISGELNGEGPIEVKEVEINDTDAQILLNNPTEYKLKEENDSYKLVKK